MQSDDLLKWLESDPGRRYTETISRRVCRYAVIHRFPLECIQFRLTSPDGQNRAVEELRSLLCEFILSAPAARKILSGPADYPVEILLERAFINHLIDRLRKRRRDPRRYLRKKFMEDISESRRLSTRSLSRNTFFGITPSCVPPAFLCEDDLREIPFPSDRQASMHFDTVSKKRNLIILAEYFFDRVCAMWQSPVCIDVRAFIDWIFLHSEPELHRADGDADRLAFSNDFPDETQPPSRDLNEERVYTWAETFARRLKEKAGRVFLNYHCREKSLEQSAAASGYAGPSGAEYRMDLIKEMLRDFLQEMPGPTENSAKIISYKLFLFFLCEILEKSYPATNHTDERKKHHPTP